MRILCIRAHHHQGALIVALVVMLFYPVRAQQAWEAAPPYGVNAFDICATTNGHMLLGGLRTYRSVDTGQTWVVEPSLVAVSRLYRMENGTLLAATDSGLRRSVNHGIIWSSIPTPTTRVYSFTESGGLALAATMDSVHVSSDHGLTWSPTASASVRNLVSTAATAFTGGDRANKRYTTMAGGTVLATTWYSYGVTRSLDGGASWDSSSLATQRIRALHVTDAGLLYAAGMGVWRSSNGGGVWQRLDTGAFVSYAEHVVALDDSLLLIAQNDRLYRSADTGQTWLEVSFRVSRLSTTYPPAQLFWYEQIRFLRCEGRVLMLGTSKSIYRSTDLGISWTAVQAGMSEVIVNRAVIRPGSGWIVMTTSGALMCSRDEGRSWRVADDIENQVFEWMLDATVADSGSFLVSGKGFIVGSVDGGDHWMHRDVSAFVDPATLPLSTPLRLAWLGSRRVGTYGESATWFSSVSTDNGWSWPLLAGGPSFFGLDRVVQITGDTLLATSTQQGVLRSTNAGASWVRTGLDAHFVESIIAPSPALLFAGTRDSGVYRSTTGGATWVQSTTGITNGKITSLLMATPTNLFAATAGAGVFRSVDSGRTWIPFNTGLDNLYVTVLALDSARRLLAGTLGGMRRTVMMVPVELASFRAMLGETAIHLRWSTANETNNAGFEIERRIDDHEGWQRIAFIAGSGTSVRGTDYAHDDPRTTLPAEAVRLRYRLRQIDHDGSVSYSPEVLVVLTRPVAEQLNVYPQPLPYGRRSIGIDAGSTLVSVKEISVHDVLGRTVFQHRNLHDEGRIELELPLLLPGVYRLALHGDGAVLVKHVIIQ